jgi:hypothetical protein
MSFISTIPNGPGNTGLSGTETRPLVDGVPVTVSEDQSRGGVFGWLDGVGAGLADTFGGLVNNAANIRADQLLSDLIGGPGESEDSTGDVNDRTGNINNDAQQQSFLMQYKTPLVIGGGLVALVALIALVRK